MLSAGKTAQPVEGTGAAATDPAPPMETASEDASKAGASRTRLRMLILSKTRSARGGNHQRVTSR
jgi:hypothetical protein